MTDELETPKYVAPYKFFLAVRFENGVKNYFFGTDDDSFKVGDKVVVESLSGLEIATVTKEPTSTEKYKSSLSLAPVLRLMTLQDKRAYEMGLLDAKAALHITKEEVEKMGLPMRLLDAHYSLDGSKCTITYTSDNRVDFRELLKVLAPRLHCRIELRQLAPRDKAKAIGGLGPCGLTLCCSTFLNSFDSISISKAKNQMLSLNIPKLSGSCGKLMCCLAYEDDLYTEARKRFPRLGSTVLLKEGTYRVDSFNILSGAVRLSKDTETMILPLEELNRKLHGEEEKPKEEPKAFANHPSKSLNKGSNKPNQKEKPPKRNYPNNAKKRA
ncbi:MAG TPA: stage 0 sporulation protein [Firmicutes bacterium]|mgnify:FL=1|nr:stage 0 sporulation protein [Bacillota bacterium]